MVHTYIVLCLLRVFKDVQNNSLFSVVELIKYVEMTNIYTLSFSDDRLSFLNVNIML